MCASSDLLAFIESQILLRVLKRMIECKLGREKTWAFRVLTTNKKKYYC